MILVLNGPNLGRLGTREPEVYGRTTYAELDALCREAGADDVRQTDDEATMLGWLHEAADSGADVVLNPAAWSHYSYALRDACSMLTGRLVEVHISQTHAREAFRQSSVVSAVATATITGLGVEGYRAALRYLTA
ncbi:MAG: 3-dehydroquinate dehydratase [Frankiales bacterium]|nr:3-dehydroquinate dehydratase [Frankiales bacterium]